jgi:uroporphyrinogen-III synthase
MLSRCGFKVRTEEIYEAVETPELSAEARDSVAAGTLDAVVLFSPRSATIFARQLRDAGLQSHCTTIAALCISAAAAEALAPLRFNGCYTAERPDQQSVIALVDTVARETAGRKN